MVDIEFDNSTIGISQWKNEYTVKEKHINKPYNNYNFRYEKIYKRAKEITKATVYMYTEWQRLTGVLLIKNYRNISRAPSYVRKARENY